jgi:glycogen debranching enzyme
MAEVIHLADPFYIVAETARSEAAGRVLKHGETFGVFDQHGDVLPAGGGEQGLYHDGTRFLSRLEILLGTRPLLLLSSSVTEDNATFTVDLTNPDVLRDEAVIIPRGEIHLFRCLVVWEGVLYQHVRVANYSLYPIEVPISVRFEADFVDLFEVRGTHRARRGSRLPDIPGGDCRTLRYRGLDGRERQTRVQWDRIPQTHTEDFAVFLLRLDPHASDTLEMEIRCEVDGNARPSRGFEPALEAAAAQMSGRRARGCLVSSSHESFNRWMTRSTSDLQMMITETPHGLYPYAGVPWFSTPFGRDGIITALELLWADPELARGVLSYLAATQATTVSDAQDAQPGKILHETRGGEMAALGEVPFGKYYGSVDATPLFVVLAEWYYERSGDGAFVERLWPHLLGAIEWMDRFGDADGDGFIEYARRSKKGLVQQGWKDSQDSVFHADGTLAEAPIALCEVQGYAYAAWQGASRLATVRGQIDDGRRWLLRAERLRERFEEAFWCEDLGTYALALDGQKRPCRVRTSNPGHCLFTGIAAADRARRVAQTLMSEESFVGWGVRTLAAGERRHNPMSYHNGSIWPHDNAMAAAGLARYGFMAEAERVFSAMCDLSQFVDHHRLPELICGFRRRAGQRPTQYPVACAPQAWASGAVYLLLQACLGLRVDGVSGRITLMRPRLPEWLDWVRLSNVRVGVGSIDLLLERHGNDVSVIVLQREGEIEIVTTK